jgi:hypothetical protein
MRDAERNTVFGEWIEAHEAILFKVAHAYGTTHSDREDLFQEIALCGGHYLDLPGRAEHRARVEA